jgi:hypothetical protein
MPLLHGDNIYYFIDKLKGLGKKFFNTARRFPSILKKRPYFLFQRFPVRINAQGFASASFGRISGALHRKPGFPL